MSSDTPSTMAGNALVLSQHEGEFDKAARAYLRDHPSEWAAYKDESVPVGLTVLDGEGGGVLVRM